MERYGLDRKPVRRASTMMKVSAEEMCLGFFGCKSPPSGCISISIATDTLVPYNAIENAFVKGEETLITSIKYLDETASNMLT